MEMMRKRKATALTVERAREVLAYDPETGVLTWKINRGPARIGAVAGAIGTDGYRLIRIDYRLYKAHRVAWLLTHGKWPRDMIDHINGNPGDNRLCNLREATPAENTQNQKLVSYNTSGIRGVRWYPRYRKWHAQLRADGRRYHLGYFADCDDAVAARRTAEKRHHGAFASV